MTADYPTWRRDRLAELDAIDAQIDKLPEIMRRQMKECSQPLRNLVYDLNLGGHVHESGKYVDKAVRQLAAELDRITVTPPLPPVEVPLPAGQEPNTTKETPDV